MLAEGYTHSALAGERIRSALDEERNRSMPDAEHIRSAQVEERIRLTRDKDNKAASGVSSFAAAKMGSANADVGTVAESADPVSVEQRTLEPLPCCKGRQPPAVWRRLAVGSGWRA